MCFGEQKKSLCIQGRESCELKQQKNEIMEVTSANAEVLALSQLA